MIEVSDKAAEKLAADDVDNRSDHAAAVVEQLAFDGHSVEEALALFPAASGKWRERYRDEAAARKDFERCWKKFGQPHVDARAANAEASNERAKATHQAANDNQPEIPTPPMHTNPFSADAAGGLLGDIARWITNTAIVPSPELSLVSAIALLAGLFGKKCLGPTDAGINVYLTTILATAGGKGHPPKAIRGLADKVGGIGAVTNGDPTSYAAIERMLRNNTSTVIVMDEFGVTLQDVNAKHRNSVAASIRKFLLAVYDQANSSFDGRIYALSETKKDDGPIQGPALTVLGMTTVETLFAGLSEASIADGFLNRFLFITSTVRGPPKPPRLHRVSKPPAELVEALQEAMTSFPRGDGNLTQVLGLGKVTVPFEGGEEGEAYRRWCEVFIWQHHGVV